MILFIYISDLWPFISEEGTNYAKQFSINPVSAL